MGFQMSCQRLLSVCSEIAFIAMQPRSSVISFDVSFQSVNVLALILALLTPILNGIKYQTYTFLAYNKLTCASLPQSVSSAFE